MKKGTGTAVNSYGGGWCPFYLASVESPEKETKQLRKESKCPRKYWFR